MSRSDEERFRVGLCMTCVHAERIRHPRGGEDYWRCGFSDVRPDFPRFPRLPVLKCEGFVKRDP